MRFIVGTLLFVGAALLLPAVLEAQQSGTAGAWQPELDLAVTYSGQRSNLTTGPVFWPQGGSVELSATLYHGFGVAMNFAGTHASNISPSGVDLTMLTT